LNLIIVLTVLAIVAAGGAFAYFTRRPKPRKNTDSLYADALNAMVRGDSDGAMRLLRDVVRQDTDHLDAYLQLGDILREEGNPQQAIKVHQSLTVRPGLSENLRMNIHKSLAQDYMSVNEPVQARKEAEMILNIDKKDVWATEFLLDLAEQNQDWGRAAQLVKALEKVKNEADITRLARFKVYEGMEKFESDDRVSAQGCFQKAVTMAPNFGLPHLYLGNLFSENRDLVKAIDHWEQYALLDTKNGSSVYSKIEAALFDLGRFSEVEKFYQRALDKNPENLDALAKIANVLEEKGESQQALELVEDALNRYENSVKLRLMKLKLSLQAVPPPQLAQQIDEMIEIMATDSNQ